jgi:hypothetical protein
LKELSIDIHDAYTGIVQIIPGEQSTTNKQFESQSLDIIYNIPMLLTTVSGVEQFTERLKSFNDSVVCKFVWDTTKDSFETLPLEKDDPSKSNGCHLSSNQRLMAQFQADFHRRFNLQNPIEVTYFGQDGSDFASPASFLKPSGTEDIHIRIDGVKKLANRITIKKGDKTWVGPFNGAYPAVHFVQDGERLDLYFEPSSKAKGRAISLFIFFPDGTLTATQTIDRVSEDQ